ncbi:MAG: hypothetical protein QOF02_2213 [Blastocatellia bacterium]|jgi:hypothetical protein|nr:hypothetical protein [Blastocatellia bacterium]
MKTTLSRSRWLRRFCLLTVAATLCCAPSHAQAQTTPDDEQDGGRGIVPVFSNARSQSGASGASGTIANAAPVYRRIARPPKQKPSPNAISAKRRNQSSEKTSEPIVTRGQKQTNVVSQSSSAQAANSTVSNNRPTVKRPVVALDAARNLGVTVWKLQPGRPFADYNQPACHGAARSTGQDGGRDIGQPVMLMPPFRSSSETLFRVGDRIRLSIESTRPGYLYIIDRELHADKTYGPPKLIFPTRRIRGGNNYLAPGSPVEFPDLCDNANYFEFLPSRGEQSPVAEALIMIVTDKPLTEVGAPADAGRIPASWLDAWEARWSNKTNVYELDEGEGQPYTIGELNAGFEIRQQGRPGARALGQGSPQPQTLYSVDTRADGMMTTVLLWYE